MQTGIATSAGFIHRGGVNDVLPLPVEDQCKTSRNKHQGNKDKAEPAEFAERASRLKPAMSSLGIPVSHREGLPDKC